jgi:hypothetical protein
MTFQLFGFLSALLTPPALLSPNAIASRAELPVEFAQAPGPLKEQSASTIGYPSVAAAMEGLRSRDGVVISIRNGWTIVEDRAGSILWSFTPSGDPAYPAVVKREVVQDGRGTSIRMGVLCEASKIACDNLVMQFNKLNAATRESVRPRP